MKSYGTDALLILTRFLLPLSHTLIYIYIYIYIYIVCVSGCVLMSTQINVILYREEDIPYFTFFVRVFEPAIYAQLWK